LVAGYGKPGENSPNGLWPPLGTLLIIQMYDVVDPG
jgi:hypothetical protein